MYSPAARPSQAARRAGEEAQVVDEERHLLVAHRLDRLADVQRLELRRARRRAPRARRRSAAARARARPAASRTSPRKARFAACTAASTSCSPDSGAVAICSPVAGLRIGSLAPSRGGPVLAVDEVLDLDRSVRRWPSSLLSRAGSVRSVSCGRARAPSASSSGVSGMPRLSATAAFVIAPAGDVDAEAQAGVARDRAARRRGRRARARREASRS